MSYLLASFSGNTFFKMLHYFTRISHIVCVFILKNANELQSTFYFHFVKYFVGLTHQTYNFQLDLILPYSVELHWPNIFSCTVYREQSSVSRGSQMNVFKYPLAFKVIFSNNAEKFAVYSIQNEELICCTVGNYHRTIIACL